ncbi:transposon Ty3-I Gag-Pol polyprotein [Trichonephila clavipes]|nr:transposon Ty3-I Gag-Pol polyprotein [Trichonephila clavipes]
MRYCRERKAVFDNSKPPTELDDVGTEEEIRRPNFLAVLRQVPREADPQYVVTDPRRHIADPVSRQAVGARKTKESDLPRSHDVILGWDFFRGSQAVIGGQNELVLEDICRDSTAPDAWNLASMCYSDTSGCLDDQQETSESQICSLMMSPELSDEQRNKLSELLEIFWAFHEDRQVDSREDECETQDFYWFQSIRAYRVSPTERRIIHERFRKCLMKVSFESPWSSPIVLSLLKSGVEFHWGPEEVEAFNSLKKALTSDPVLGMYDERATEIHTDASGILQEGLPDGPSDQEHDFDVKYKTGKKHSDADALSRNPVEEETETSDKFFSSHDEYEPDGTEKDLAKLKLLSNSSKNEEFRFIDGILCRKNFDPDGKLWLPVIPKHLRADILRHFHDAPTAGHLGFAKTLTGYAKRFYWPGMYRNVVRYVMHCRECQRKSPFLNDHLDV